MRKEINSSDCLVAYLDMLGYRDRVNSEKVAKELFIAIDSAFSSWGKYISESNLAKSGVFEQCVSVEILSDTFVVVFDRERFWGGDKEPAIGTATILNVFLVLISYLLQSCTNESKLLFRGAIARGQYYQNILNNLEGGKFIFSRGLIIAYEIAENLADVPRIIVDKSALEGVDVDKYSIQRHRPTNTLLRDEDGLYVLNIYSSISENVDLITQVFTQTALLIKENLTRHKENLNVLRKYVWYANYHNKIAHFLISDDRLKSHLAVKEEALIIQIPTVV